MRELTIEENILLHLLQRGLSENVTTLSDDVLRQADWRAIMEESRAQAVLVQAFDAAAAYKKFIPDEVYQEWFRRSSRSLANNLQIAKAQNDLVTLLKRAEHPYLILKGFASAQYYPRPELRSQGDVDFLIVPEEKNSVRMLMEKNGCINEAHDHDFHVAFKKAGVCLEMHFDIPGVPFGTLGTKIRDFMENAQQEARSVQVDGCQFLAPDEARHGLVLLLHMQQHMLVEGLGLRHLLDWACYVSKTAYAPFWEERLLPLLQEIGLLRYASAMTQTCSRYLGICCPNWVEDVEEGLCGEIMFDILTGGNFGRKEKIRSKAGMMVSFKGKNGTENSVTGNMMKILLSATERKHPIVKKVKILLPLFAAYRGVLYAVRSLAGKRVSVTDMIPLAQERKSTYEKLKIFEID